MLTWKVESINLQQKKGNTYINTKINAHPFSLIEMSLNKSMSGTYLHGHISR